MGRLSTTECTYLPTSGHHRPCDLRFRSSTTVVDRNCAVVNMSKSVLGHTKVKQVKQCHEHVENMVKT